MSDTKEYLEHIRTLSEGKDVLTVLQAAPRRLDRLITGVPENRLRQAPHPGKWSVTQIIAHLAEDELVTSWRYRQMLEAPGCALPGFDQDAWAEYGHYDEWSSKEALAMFALLRLANVRMLRRLTEEQWQRHGMHAERGRITVRDLASHMVGHDLNHLQQVQRILKHD